ncbi:hypothetical protein [Streptosporangium sandarakinum]
MSPLPAPPGRGAPATGRANATASATTATRADQRTCPPVAGRGHRPAPAEPPATRPGGEALTATATTLAALLADLDGQHRRERDAYAQGYRDGHRSGWEIGYRHAHHEMAASWQTLAEQVRRMGRTRTHPEVEHRRWDGRREDFAKPRPDDRQTRRLAAATALHRRSA